jgi:hypothetical protein
VTLPTVGVLVVSVRYSEMFLASAAARYLKRDLCQSVPVASAGVAHEERAVEQEKDVVLRLRYRPPYDGNSIVAFLEARVISGVE